MPFSDAKSLIHERLGLRFDGPRERQLRRALEQRMQATATASLGEYLKTLRRTPTELQTLAGLLTINETYFDREPHHLQLLAEHLLPRLLANRNAAPPIAILSLGCSSGEEPYSIAMTLHERWGRRAAELVRISGADLDETRIGQARIGCYHEHAFRTLSAPRWERWFVQRGAHRYCLQEQIRKTVSFHALNVLEASLAKTLGRQHIVFYRNLSIYFDADTRAQALRQIQRLLHPGGYLVVGTTEVLANDIGLFTLHEHQGVWYFMHDKDSAASAASGATSRSSTPARQSTRESTRTKAQAPALAERTPEAQATAARARSSQSAISLRYRRALALVRDDRLSAGLAELRALPPIESASAERVGVDAFLLKASLLLELSQVADAQADAEAVLAYAPWSAAALTLLARVAQRTGESERALAQARRAVYAEPNFWPAHLLLADLYRARGEVVQAQRAYAIVLRQLEDETAARLVAGPLPLPLPITDLRALCRARLAQLASTA